jgi:Fe-Mn family superoxide dismutase
LATLAEQQTYAPKKFDLSGLQGISDNTLTVHFGLYEGYVKNTNLLNEQISGLIASGSAAGSNPGYAELKRRLGFEYNGMVLHEYYFGNMTKTAGSSAPAKVQDCVAGTFGDFETWKKDFSAVGAMRGVGWAIAYFDPTTQRVNNHWITLHEDGNVAGYVPLLVMDVWEHAFLLDYKPAERSKYIESFFLNVDWGVVNRRLEAAKAGRTP